MVGIQPLSGKFKEIIEREASEVRCERIITINELEMEIRHLKGRLSIAQADIQGLKRENEALRDSICTRPLNPKRGWEMPEAPTCQHCQTTSKPFAEFMGDWALGFTCCSCDSDYKIPNPIDWPFEGNQTVYASDMERIGFLVP